MPTNYEGDARATSSNGSAVGSERASDNPSALQGDVNPAELGPRVLMFSGGSALHGLCQTLKNHTHNSVHLLTPFDSGGSSQALRRAFSMPAVGDLRQRLMALADDSVPGNAEICRLCAYRLSLGGSEHRQELAAMISGQHAQALGIPAAQHSVIARLLHSLLTRLPGGVDLRGACIGNLMLAGGYLESERNLQDAVTVFSELVSARGVVLPVVSDSAHLFIELENGRSIIGQHELTGKETLPIESPVRHLSLSRHAERYEPTKVVLGDCNRNLIESADLICFAPGSFYSSLIATLLPEGVGSAIAANPGPKVFVPNLGVDPEQLGMSFQQSVSVLLSHLMQGAAHVEPVDVLTHVITDVEHGLYPSPVNRAELRELGIELIHLPLVTPHSSPYYDNAKLLQALLSLS